MLDGLDSSNLAGSGLVQSGGCHWAHQISGSCWFYLIFCQFGVLRAQKLLKMCTKMLVFSVANSQNTYYGLKRVFFGISEMGTPPILKGRRGLSAENLLCSSTAAPDSGWTWQSQCVFSTLLFQMCPIIDSLIGFQRPRKRSYLVRNSSCRQ